MRRDREEGDSKKMAHYVLTWKVYSEKDFESTSEYGESNLVTYLWGNLSH